MGSLTVISHEGGIIDILLKRSTCPWPRTSILVLRVRNVGPGQASAPTSGSKVTPTTVPPCPCLADVGLPHGSALSVTHRYSTVSSCSQHRVAWVRPSTSLVLAVTRVMLLKEDKMRLTGASSAFGEQIQAHCWHVVSRNSAVSVHRELLASL